MAECPGCGLLADEAPADNPRFTCSTGCWTAYTELSAHTLSIDLAGGFFHQTGVDTYAAQHPRLDRPATLAFALAGLHLVLDVGRTGFQVQQAHTALSERRVVAPAFPILPTREAGTVADALRRVRVLGAQNAVEEWSRRVWKCYGPVHADVAAWIAAWPTPATAAANR